MAGRFTEGAQYTRREIRKLLGLEEKLPGNWRIGYTQHEGESFIFAAVNASGRTGHDYKNRWEGDHLIWYGRYGSQLSHESIRRMIQPGSIVNIFTRESDRGPFTYRGQARPVAQPVERQVYDETGKARTSVEIEWGFGSGEVLFPDELEPPDQGLVSEGAKVVRVLNAYERNPEARRRCIAKWGAACSVCSLSFSDRYGSLGEGFIHVHHLVPVSERGEEYLLNPEEDLRPVCPNCHAMLHRKRDQTLSIEELRNRLLG